LIVLYGFEYESAHLSFLRDILMKPIICTTVIFLTLASFASAHANGALDSKVPHLSHSAANPSNARVPFSSYHVGIHVSGYPLSRLTVELPKAFTVSKDITVRDKTGQKIEAAISVEAGKAKFIFAQPVAPETRLELVFNAVKTSTQVSHVWLLPVSGQRADTSTEIQLGTAEIRTYN
jgi:hypothetical protein